MPPPDARHLHPVQVFDCSGMVCAPGRVNRNGSCEMVADLEVAVEMVCGLDDMVEPSGRG